MLLLALVSQPSILIWFFGLTSSVFVIILMSSAWFLMAGLATINRLVFSGLIARFFLLLKVNQDHEVSVNVMYGVSWVIKADQ